MKDTVAVYSTNQILFAKKESLTRAVFNSNQEMDCGDVVVSIMLPTAYSRVGGVGFEPCVGAFWCF